MPRFKEQAVCIRHLDWSETSQVVVLFTENRGKLRGLAKGSRRTSPGAVARFSGGIELLTLGQVVGMTRPSSELATITEWDLQQPFHHLRTSLEAHRLGLYAADLAGAMLADEDAHPRSFAAMVDFLHELDKPAARPAALLKFQWRLLADCGYRPRLDNDARSGSTLAVSDAYLFDAHAGGLTALNDSHRPGRDLWRVRRETVELLRRVREHQSIDDAPPGTITRANRLLCVYARAILSRPLPTMQFVFNSEVDG